MDILRERNIKKQIGTALSPLRIFMTVIGRFPFTKVPEELDPFNHLYIFSWKGPGVVTFIVSSLFICSWLIFGLCGYLDLYLNLQGIEETAIKKSNDSSMELDDIMLYKELLSLIDENLVIMIPMLAMILNTIIQSLVALLNGSKASQFLTKWKDDLAFIKIDIGDGMRNQVIFEILFIVFFIFLIFLAFAIPFETNGDTNIHFIRNTVTAVKVATFRSFMEDPRKLGTGVDIGILVMTCYVFSSYKCCLFFYNCVCQSLSNGFKTWNQMTENYFDNLPSYGIPKSKKDNDPYNLIQLVESHFLLIELVKNTDDIFAPIITTYFFTQVIIICFIIYEVIELGLTMMSVWAVLLLVQTSLILYLVANTATKVHEEAMAGFGSLRWAYLRHMTSEEERNVQTLLTSFSGPPIMLTGARLFGIHRPFILTIFGVIVTYFVVLYQIMRAP